MSSDDFEFEFVYNDEGIRTQKIANGSEIHTYHLSGSQIISEEWGNHLLVYLYDSNGSSMGMQYRRSSMAAGEFYTFWFEKNLQGDIVAVYNSAGTKVVSYAYDAWGNCIATNHNITGNNLYATFNPFRYRGYYYDSELGFYYLNSRYYDPSIGRFINADALISTGQGLLGYNMFAYCGNNPILFVDCSGQASMPFWDLEYPGSIHRAVQLYICANYSGYEMERYVSCGRVDLINTTNNNVYELKPCTYGNKRLGLAQEQLSGYLDALGDGYQAGTEKISGEFIYMDYYVKYWTKADGILYYHFRNKDEFKYNAEDIPVFVPKKEEKSSKIKNAISMPVTNQPNVASGGGAIPIVTFIGILVIASRLTVRPNIQT